MKSERTSLQRTGRRVVAGVIAFLCVFSMIAAMLPVKSFAAANDAVNEAKNGVVQVNLTYRDDNSDTIILQQGTGFLINNEYVVTCYHVVNIDDKTKRDDDMTDLEFYADYFGKKKAEVKDRLGYSITINRDVYISASNVQQSYEVDWTVLKLSQPIQNKKPLSLRSSSTVAQTENAYAIGFPAESARMQDINTYTSEDTTITEGSVNKITTGTNLLSNAMADYIQTSVKMTSGNSGGPMVDEDGYVIGICEGASGEYFQDDYYYAIAIDQVIEVLDALGIQYTKGGGEAAPEPAEEPEAAETPEVTEAPEPEPAAEIEEADKGALAAAISAAEALDGSKYTPETVKEVTAALEEAKKISNKADATQEEVDAAVKALQDANANLKKDNKLMLILIIAAIVVVIVVILIVVLLLSGKKKKAAQAAKKARAAAAPRMQTTGTEPVRPQGGFTPTPMAPAQDSGETTVLSSAGETTLLNRKVNGGTLVRVKTGDKIAVDKEEFKIGREQKDVDYWIAGNTTVGRVHAKIIYRNGSAYLVDLNAKNGTFLNGVKCSPNQEVQIKSGDKLAFSDEEFTYQA